MSPLRIAFESFVLAHETVVFWTIFVLASLLQLAFVAYLVSLSAAEIRKWKDRKEEKPGPAIEEEIKAQAQRIRDLEKLLRDFKLPPI